METTDLIRDALKNPGNYYADDLNDLIKNVRAEIDTRMAALEDDKRKMADPMTSLDTVKGIRAFIGDKELMISRLTEGVRQLIELRDQKVEFEAAEDRERIEAAANAEFDAQASVVIEKIDIMREISADLRKLEDIIRRAKGQLDGRFSRSFASIGIESFLDQIEGVHGALHIASGMLANVPKPESEKEIRNAA